LQSLYEGPASNFLKGRGKTSVQGRLESGPVRKNEQNEIILYMRKKIQNKGFSQDGVLLSACNSSYCKRARKKKVIGKNER